MPTVLIVPGLRDAIAEHWQTLLAARLSAAGRAVRSLPALGRENLSSATRVGAIEREVRAIDGPVILVAHSGGVVAVLLWAEYTQRAVLGALLATPPDFDTPMPAGYPTLAELDAEGWLPVPRRRLPFPSIVAASRDDPLASFERVGDFARSWGSRLVDLGHVGHLNPASGFGPWPRAEALIDELAAGATAAARP